MLVGLSLGADYWSIDLDHAIQSPAPNAILASCFEAADPSSCDRIHRDPAHGDAIDFIDTTPSNLGATAISGLDIAAGYDHRFGDLGQLHGRLDLQYLRPHGRATPDSNTATGYESIQTSNTLQVYHGSPAVKASMSSTWLHPSGARGGLALHYVDGFQLHSAVTSAPLADRDVPAWYEVDVFGGYSFHSSFGVSTASAGINNLLDRAPPTPPFAGQRAGLGAYDLIGRFFYLRLSHRY